MLIIQQVGGWQWQGAGVALKGPSSSQEGCSSPWAGALCQRCEHTHVHAGAQIPETVYPMYKAFIEPDLKLAQLRIYNSFNPFAGARPGPGAPVCGHR